ncbi:MAG TPA: selenocysteine-specific translation elongation factor, partial [Pyrinomonadaceae bacterium]|nr:selenocysteine-specific translation elongation factor [Pyrinomonadaceae bacterium]
MDIIVGTAGHIDHGKTALVKALTGVDADRLPEEKQRGITIDLGFAEMHDGETRIGFVDVPGHERFVKNMLAGASGIDLVLLVIAADEGVMPQTREHFDICRLLRIRNGVVVLTKSDLVDPDTLELARLDAAELVRDSFLEFAPVYVVSSRSGDGIDELKSGLLTAARDVHRDKDIFEARLSVDRSFSIKGFGAVVTGTLASGEVADGDELELLPVGRKLRVRGVQTHGKSVAAAHAGQRTAVNLAGIDYADVNRGMVLVSPGTLSVAQTFDAEIEMLPDAPRSLRSRQRVRVHLGTAEVLARVSVLNEDHEIAPGAKGFAQLRLEVPVAGAHGDRFIIRSYSPQHTIAGGRVLDPVAQRHRRSEFPTLSALLGELSKAADGAANSADVFVRMSAERGTRFGELRSRTGLKADALEQLIEDARTRHSIIDAGGVLVSETPFEKLKAAALAAIEAHHRSDKLSRGLQKETLREKIFKRSQPEVFRAVTGILERDGKISSDQDVFKLASHELQLSAAERAAFDKLRRIYS